MAEELANPNGSLSARFLARDLKSGGRSKRLKSDTCPLLPSEGSPETRGGPTR